MNRALTQLRFVRATFEDIFHKFLRLDHVSHVTLHNQLADIDQRLGSSLGSTFVYGGAHLLARAFQRIDLQIYLTHDKCSYLNLKSQVKI